MNTGSIPHYSQDTSRKPSAIVGALGLRCEARKSGAALHFCNLRLCSEAITFVGSGVAHVRRLSKRKTRSARC